LFFFFILKYSHYDHAGWRDLRTPLQVRKTPTLKCANAKIEDRLFTRLRNSSRDLPEAAN
jgi:hypothetical protein